MQLIGLRISLVFLFILSFTLNPAYASELRQFASLKDLSLEELMEVEVATVYSASKHEQKVTEAPSSVTIITGDDIRKFGYRSLTDILKSVRGFYVTYDRNYHFIGVRGFARPGDYNGRILLLVNGHRVNDNIYDSALIDLDILVDHIDRVEVIRGPGSSLYGSNAFFGIINVISKKGSDIEGVEISGEASRYDTYKTSFVLGKKLNSGPDVLISGSLLDGKGQDLFFKEFRNPSTNYGLAGGCDYSRNSSLFSRISYGGLTVEGSYLTATKGVPTASYGTVFNDPRNRTYDERGYLDLNYNKTLGGSSEIQAGVYYDYNRYAGDYILDYPPVTLNKDLSWGSWWGGELKFITGALEKHTITLGAEYRDNVRQEQKNYDSKPYYSYLKDRRHSAIRALYIQDEFEITKELLFDFGVRYDNYDTFGGSTNPRLALIYKPFDSTFIKLLYGEAFRAPNAYELYYQDGGSSMKSNPGLKPETVKTYELVLEQYIGKHILITAAGFYNKIKDLISQQTDPGDGLLIFRNAERIESKGLEFEIEADLKNGIKGRLSYTFQETEDKNTGETLTNSPKHLAAFNVIIPVIKEKLFAGMEEQYMGRRKTLTNRYTDGFFLTNLTLFSSNILKGLEVSGSVYNLFGNKYRDPGSGELRQDSIEQDGRNYRLKLTYRFDL